MYKLPAELFLINFLIICEFRFSFQSRLKPGRMLLVDVHEKSFIQDLELKTKIAKSRPHGEWLEQQVSKHFQV
jgi:Glutamine amidotransferases class-II